MAIVQPCITTTSFYHQNLGSNNKLTHPPKFTTININRSCKLTPLITCSTNNNTNVLLFEAAKHTVDTYLRSGMVVGLGSGIASSLAIEYLGHKLRVGLLKDVVGIPTTVGSATEAEKAGIPLHQYQNSSKIDFAFNDADIVEERSLNAVIRHQRLQGGESMIEETKILDVTQNLVLMVTDKQYKSVVEGSIPVFVNAVSWMDTAEEIDDLFVGDAETIRAAILTPLVHCIHVCLYGGPLEKENLYTVFVYEGLEKTINRACRSYGRQLSTSHKRRT